MLISHQVGRLVAYALLVAFVKLTCPWKSSNGVTDAFLVPQNSCRIAEKKVQGRCRSRRIRQRLSLAPETAATAATSPPSTAELDVNLLGKDAVEQAAQRLVPLFAEVDAHTQR